MRHSRTIEGAPLEVEPPRVRVGTFLTAAVFQLAFVLAAVLFGRDGLWVAAVVVGVLGVVGGLGMVWVEARR